MDYYPHTQLIMNSKNTHSIVFRSVRYKTTYWEKYHSYKTIQAAEQAMKDMNGSKMHTDYMEFKIVPYFEGNIYRDK
jgi:hypothetical protein